MNLSRRASLRHLTRHPSQLALSVLGVALGVAVVVAIDLAIDSAREGFRVSTETVAGRATHSVVSGPGGIPDSVFRRVRVEAAVRSSAPVVEGVADSPALPGLSLTVLGIDPFSETPFRPYLAGGRGDVDMGAFLTTPRAVALSSETSREAGVGPGDTLRVRVAGTLHTLHVVGVIEGGDRLAREGLRGILVMDVSGAQELLGRVGRLDRIDLVLPEGPEGDRVLSRVRAVIPRSAHIEAAGARADTMAGMIGAFDLNLTALSLLALVFGMFLIFNAFTFSVVQRRGIFGTLRALGVTRGGVLAIVLGEAMVLGVVGTALGLAAGVGLGQGLVRLVTRTINDLYFVVSVQGVALSEKALIKGALLGLAATLVSALPAAVEAIGIPPRGAMTRSVVEDRMRAAVPRAAAFGVALGLLGGAVLLIPSKSVLLGFAGLFPAILGMALLTPWATVQLVRLVHPLLGRTGGVLGTMAARGVVTSLSRTAPAVAALVVSVSVTVGLGVMIESFRSTVARWLDGTLQADYYVSLPSAVRSRPQETLAPELVAALSRNPAVVGRSTYRGTVVSAPWGDVRVVALDLDPRGEASFDFLEGDPGGPIRAFRSSDAVLASEPLAMRHDLAVGSTVKLATEDGYRPFRVAGVFRDYGSDRGVLMMNRETFDTHWTDPGVTSMGLFLARGADVRAVASELRSAVPAGTVVDIRSNRELREASLEVFERTFRVTSVLRMLAFLVAFIGILGALMALQLERTRELGVLRAHGLTPLQVWTLVTGQTAVMGLISGILALPVGLVLAVAMIFVVNRRSFGWTLHMDVGPEILAQAVGLALLGATLAGLYPAWRMSRVSPAVALREE